MNGLRVVLFGVNSEPPMTEEPRPLSFYAGAPLPLGELLPETRAFKQAEEAVNV